MFSEIVFVLFFLFFLLTSLFRRLEKLYIIVCASRIPPRPLEALRLRCLVAQFDERELGTTDGTCGWSFAGFERPLRLGGPLSCLCLSSWASRDLLVGLW